MKMICINCPRGCEMEVCRDGENVVVTGNGCAKGEAYAKSELVNPTRMVTGLVRIAGMRKPLPVKTRTAIPKPKIDAVLFAMHQTTIQLPVKIGDVIIPDAAGTGVDVVATANM
ncbi:MAG: DUF1667 domain-containing protein [Kiritimatiellae bacterium]|nr:DUF1667 domain-containing protein [Kiritimatiellia bacterium]